MKPTTIIGRIMRAAVYTVAALVLLLCGLIIMLYSPWSQEMLRESIVKKFNDGASTKIELQSFRLKFPLKLNATGFALIADSDTMVTASGLDIDIAALPLLKGDVQIRHAQLESAYYRMGAPDSAMFMTIAADTLSIAPASVHLSDMAIRLDEGRIKGGRVAMTLSTDTTPSQPSEPTRMSIDLGRLTLDDFAYTMRMLPTIDTLSAHMAHATLSDGAIDLLNQKISLARFGGSTLDARYIAPDSATVASVIVPQSSEPADSASAPWTINIDSIGFSSSHALYTTAGVTPVPGLDFAYIEVGNLDLRIRNFYNQAATVRLPLSLRGTERCGVELAIDGELDIDPEALTFKDVNLSTPTGTAAAFHGKLGMGDMVTDPNLPLALTLDGGFAPADLSKMFPAFALYLDALPTANAIETDIAAEGTTGRLDIQKLDVQVNHCINLLASGRISNFMNPDKMNGDLRLKGNIINVNRLKTAALGAETASTFAVPPMSLAGHVTLNGATYAGNLQAATGKGIIALDGRFNGNLESYAARVRTRGFPVQAFLPDMGVGAVTAAIDASGHGFDPFSKSTCLKAKADIASAEYAGVTYTDITAAAVLDAGQAAIDLNSANPDAEIILAAKGNLDGDTYTWHADIDGRHIDLYALKFAAEPSSLELVAGADATIGPGKNDINGHLVLNDLFFNQKEGTIALSDVNVHLNSSDSLTNLSLQNRDLYGNFSAPSALMPLVDAFSHAGQVIASQISTFTINADTLATSLPKFSLDLRGGNDNLVNDVLAPSKMSVRSFALNADNDSTLVLNGSVRRFDTGSMRLDSIFIDARGADSLLIVDAGLLNKPGNMDEWHKVDLKGVIRGNRASLGLHQENLKGKTGFEFGMRAVANAADSLITVSVNPFDPVIGYQQWSVNDDNFISYCMADSHIDANLYMKGGNSSLAIYTEHPEGEEHHDEQEDLVVKLGDIHIADWISFNPFAPPVKGDINADVRVNRHGTMFTGSGSASIVNFYYGREKVADFKADFDVAAQADGTLHATADLYADGVKTITVSGALNDSTATSPLALDLSMIRFPLATANPFLPKGTASLRGVLNGNLKISGTEKAPVYNGTFDFDSTAVLLALTGTEYTFSESKIDVENSIVRFDNFAIAGCNDNPLTVNGTVDMTDMANLRLNLGLRARDMMIVNTNRARRGADVYGKAYISLDANAHGSMALMNVNADLKLLSETNVTYVIPDATTALSNKSTGDMVKFVNFTDSLAVEQADSLVRSGMALFLDASLAIEEGSIINVDLSADGKNKAQIESNGILSFSMTPLDEGRLTGRLTIDKGFVRYTPPFMSEKNFSFDEGSYVAFNGDMMNPVLNIHATDVLKANVTQSGQNSRLVNFDVLLGVTGTLANMDVAFDLKTNDDMTVANELESMSAEQRANQAMNLLLYNVYTGPGTKGNASLSGNPLFSFLESQINTWAANNIKGVDISFGIDQYDKTVGGNTSSTMSYSYQVSKSLFNDRFKIVVGGNYSTDANADENFSQNLINDISFEYFLNKQRSMYLRLFRHTGYESILEGEITQTGVGFVYRRKLRRIGDMFLSPGAVRRRDEAENSELNASPEVQPDKAESK